MTAYLGLREAIWPQVLERENHKHGVGEDPSRCANCRLAKDAMNMSAFEVAAWIWYQDTVSTFSLTAGIVAEAFRELQLRGELRKIFMKALDMIHLSESTILAEKIKKAREEAESRR